jgi:glycosyltransferase involved in cell wall biosynthesis
MNTRNSTEMLPKVSILIITYNQEHFIAEAIESAASQSYENLEVIVADDCSTDETPGIIREFEERYSGRVMGVFGEKNVGVTGNSNRALNSCSGELIAFQGGDDVLLPGKISKQVAWFLEDPRNSLCVHPVEVFYDDESRPPKHSRLMTKVDVRKLLLNGVPAGATSVMVRANQIPPHGFDESLPVMSDYMLWLEILARGGLYGSIDEVLARQRKHDSNVTKFPIKYIDDYLNTYRRFAERFPSYRTTCEIAINRNYRYYNGVLLRAEGEKKAAASYFKAAIVHERSFFKAWVRLAQALL